MRRGAVVVLVCLALLGCSQPTAEPAATADQTPAYQGLLNGAVIDARVSAELDRCLSSGEAAQGATFPMFDCLTAEIAVQDEALNTAYRSLIAASRRSDAETLESNPDDAYGARHTARIIEAQKAWITYRDAKCLSENDGEGQIERFSGYPSCLITETIKRTLELEALKADLLER